MYRYCYLKGTEFKLFRSRAALREWAVDESHDGKYFISTPDRTYTYNRVQILNRIKGVHK